jgi:hypothetical protein
LGQKAAPKGERGRDSAGCRRQELATIEQRVTPGSRATLYHGRAENPFKIKDPDNLNRVVPRLTYGPEVRA